MEKDNALRRNSSELLADSESHQQTHEGDSEDASWPLIGALRRPSEPETRLVALMSMPKDVYLYIAESDDPSERFELLLQLGESAHALDVCLSLQITINLFVRLSDALLLTV